LCADADASLVQRLDRHLVALADLAEHIRGRYAAVLEDELARARRPDPELVFLLADREAGHAAFDQERRDTAVTGLRIHRGEHDEEVRFVGVRDPELPPLQDEMVAVLPRA